MSLFRILIRLSFLSLKNRALTSSLAIISISISVSLLLGVEQLRQSARESFAGTISGADLIVGPRGGEVQLLLYTVFHKGSPTTTLDFGTFKKFATHPDVSWAVPISLGDSHRGYPIVATNHDFFIHYRYRENQALGFKEGNRNNRPDEIILGSDVARRLRYKMGDSLIVTHGMGSIPGAMDHDDKPFIVSGILRRTGTPVDRSLFISLEGLEMVHADWERRSTGLIPPINSMMRHVSGDRHGDDHEINKINAFILGTKSRISTLQLQREINEYKADPIMAIIPAATMGELWRTISYAEDALKLISFFVILSGLTGVLMTLYTSLNERRREMAILRTLGAGPGSIFTLLILESSILTLAGAIFGVLLVYILFFLIRPYVEIMTGIAIAFRTPGTLELIYLFLIIFAGIIIGLLPARMAYKNALYDGLSMRL